MISKEKLKQIKGYGLCPFDTCRNFRDCADCAQKNFKEHAESIIKEQRLRFIYRRAVDVIPETRGNYDTRMSKLKPLILEWLEEDFTSVFNELSEVRNDK